MTKLFRLTIWTCSQFLCQLFFLLYLLAQNLSDVFSFQFFIDYEKYRGPLGNVRKGVLVHFSLSNLFTILLLKKKKTTPSFKCTHLLKTTSCHEICTHIGGNGSMAQHSFYILVFLYSLIYGLRGCFEVLLLPFLS